MARTVALRVCGMGCGLCTEIRSVPFFKSTRDPARSDTSTSAALSIASISANLMSAGVGLAKTFSKVR